MENAIDVSGKKMVAVLNGMAMATTKSKVLRGKKMNIAQIEYAAEMFFRMCREHPEVCPHDYHWNSSTIDKANNMEIKRYICGLCGKELKEKIKLSN